MTNLIPGEIDAPAAKRGGWTYASEDLSGAHAGADVVQSMIYAPFSGGAQLVAISRNLGTDSQCQQIVSTSSTIGQGVCNDPAENLSFFRDNVVITGRSGNAVPDKYGGVSDATDITGSPPTGSRSTVYKDRLVLARSSANLNRVWFSEAGDIDDWDTTNRWIDTTGEVTALYALRNSIIVFHPSSLERIIGSIPPPGSDMFLQPVFDTGTLYPLSLAGTDQFVCFANPAGVYMTDGSQVVDLTRAGGIKDLWRTSVADATSSLSLPGGYFRGYYWVVVKSSSTTLFHVFAVHVDTQRWLRFTNIPAWCFARRNDTQEELYFGSMDEARVASLSSLFSPTSSNKNDADGTAVGWTLELPYVGISESKGRLKNVYVKYDLRDAATDNPTIAASYILSPESTSYTSITNTLSERTEMDWERRSDRKSVV